MVYYYITYIVKISRWSLDLVYFLIITGYLLLIGSYTKLYYVIKPNLMLYLWFNETKYSMHFLKDN